MTIIAGVDPGLHGGIAFLSPDGCETLPMPILHLTRGGKAKGEIDAHTLAQIFWQRHAGHAFVEQVGAMPGQGATSMFAFGQGYGMVRGILAAVGVPYTLVSPRKWKAALGVPASKDGARARASQLLPGAADQWPRVKDDGRAEAALIALHGQQSLEGIYKSMADAIRGAEWP